MNQFRDESNTQDESVLEPNTEESVSRIDEGHTHADDDDIIVEEEGVANRIKKLKEQLSACQKERQEYLDGWQRSKAEFVNARKRDEEAQKDFVRFSNENLITELIPVLDSFNMAMNNKEAWEKVDKNWRIGVEYIAHQLKKVLEDNGLKEIDPIGKVFDPMRDEAVEDGKQSDIITTVVSKGYELNGKVIKAPKVKVGETKTNH